MTVEFDSRQAAQWRRQLRGYSGFGSAYTLIHQISAVSAAVDIQAPAWLRAFWLRKPLRSLVRSWDWRREILDDMSKKNVLALAPRKKPRPKKKLKPSGRKVRSARFSPPLTISSPELLIGGSDDQFREVVYLFVKTLGRFISCREAFGGSINLTGSQFAVLVGVAYRQGENGVTVKELSRHVQLAPTHVTTEVGRLNHKGLLDKKIGTEDRRSVLVSLTPEGEAAVVSVASFCRRINDLLFDGVTATELAAAQATFEKLSRNSEYALAGIKLIERDASHRVDNGKRSRRATG